MTTTETEAAPVEEIRRAFLNPAFDVEREPLETRRQSQYWAKPYRNRLSEYESLLLYAQTSPEWIPGAMGNGGFGARFAGGRSPWENYTTEAKSSDWFVFRDPSGRGQPTYVAQKAEEDAETHRLWEAYAQQGLYRNLDREWTFEILPGLYGAYAILQYGLFMSLAGPSRDAFTDVLRAAIVTAGLDHLDNAEMIQAEKVFLSKNVDGFSADVAPAREAWQNHPVYQTARQITEDIWVSTPDHIEAVFANLMVFGPLLGRFARQQFFHALAPLHGDQLTPAIMWPTITNMEIDAKWALELFGYALGKDPKFADHNKALMRLWARRWYPKVIQSMAEFAPMYVSTSTLRNNLGAQQAESAARMVIGDWTRRYTPVFELDVDVDDLVQRVVSGLPKAS